MGNKSIDRRESFGQKQIKNVHVDKYRNNKSRGETVEKYKLRPNV